MSDGREHTGATTALILEAVVVISVAYDWTDVVAIALGNLLGQVLGPDLDVDGGNVSLAHLRKLPAGGVVAGVWRLFWLPYAKAIPHRHPLSHMPLLGTAGRLLYVVTLGVLPVWLALGAPVVAFHPLFWRYALDVVAGLAVTDTGHWLMDGRPMKAVTLPPQV